MDFYDVLDQVLALLQRRGRVTYRALKLQFQLDDEQLAVLKDELLYAHPQVIEDASRGLIWTGETRPTPTPESPPTSDQERAPRSYTLAHLSEKILQARLSLEGEPKQVTVLSADLKGSMELLADRDPEEARQLLDPILTLMMEAIHRYEGTVNQVMGDGIMALFGAPLAHEDHAVRACYAALRMQDAIGHHAAELGQRHGLDVQIRVGLNSGAVVVRSIGSDLHMDYTAVGQTTHLAARLEQLAQPGTTLLVVFEDLHWIDSETQVLLDGLVESLPAARLLLLVNYRPEYQHPWSSRTAYTQLRLDPLPPERAQELLGSRLGPDAGLFPELEYTCKHALTHEVTYGSLLQDRRRTLHGRIVQTIERRYSDRLPEHLERLAHHAFRGEEWEKAVTYLRHAGARAFARSSNRETLAYFEQALTALTHLPEARETREQAVDIRFDLRNALFPLAEFGRIEGYLREAEALARTLDDQRRLGWVSTYMASHHQLTGGHAADVRTFAQRVEAIGEAHLLAAQVEDARACADRAVRLARQRGERGHEAWTFRLLGEIASHPHRPDMATAEAHYGAAIALADELGRRPLQAHCHRGLGTLYATTGQREQAHAELSITIELYKAMEMTFWLPQAEASLARVEGR